jgi:hypothetical protein
MDVHTEIERFFIIFGFSKDFYRIYLKNLRYADKLGIFWVHFLPAELRNLKKNLTV